MKFIDEHGREVILDDCRITIEGTVRRADSDSLSIASLFTLDGSEDQFVFVKSDTFGPHDHPCISRTRIEFRKVIDPRRL